MEPDLMALVRAIIAGDAMTVSKLLDESPGLAGACATQGATRHDGQTYFLTEIEHHLYHGDTGLHVAAAAYRADLARQLLDRGAAVSAGNRRGAQPLHYAADGRPGSARWNPGAQAATIRCLIEAGADPNAVDKNGATPLHRAVRTRCAAAVGALLAAGADPRRKNKRGSTPLALTRHNTGRGGSGTPEGKSEREQIARLLEQHDAATANRW